MANTINPSYADVASAGDMRNSVKTIEVSSIDSNYVLPTGLYVESVVFIPGASGDVVDIVDAAESLASGPVKAQLKSGDGEPRIVYFDNRLRLGFVFADGTFTAGAKVIFNIGQRA